MLHHTYCIVFVGMNPLLLSGPAKRYRVKAIQTSKRCNIVCMYTTFAATDSNGAAGLPANLEVRTGV